MSHKGVSIPIAVYQHLEEEYEELRTELYLKYGITTFTGFIVWRLRESIDRHRKGESADWEKAYAKAHIRKSPHRAGTPQAP